MGLKEKRASTRKNQGKTEKKNLFVVLAGELDLGKETHEPKSMPM